MNTMFSILSTLNRENRFEDVYLFKNKLHWSLYNYVANWQRHYEPEPCVCRLSRDDLASVESRADVAIVRGTCVSDMFAGLRVPALHARGPCSRHAHLWIWRIRPSDIVWNGYWLQLQLTDWFQIRKKWNWSVSYFALSYCNQNEIRAQTIN